MKWFIFFLSMSLNTLLYANVFLDLLCSTSLFLFSKDLLSEVRRKPDHHYTWMNQGCALMFASVGVILLLEALCLLYFLISLPPVPHTELLLFFANLLTFSKIVGVFIAGCMTYMYHCRRLQMELSSFLDN